MHRTPLFFAILVVFAISSCTTTSQVSLDYVPGTGRTLQGAAEFITQPFVDRRDVGPNELGTVRTQLGTPLEKVQTRVPVAQIVTNAFGHALQTRKMLSAKSAARYMVTGEVLDLHCNLLVHPYGYAKLRVNIIEAGTGRIVHSGIYEGERQSRAYVPGSGTPVPMLGDLASGALQDAVDQALDDQGMRAQLGGARPMESSS
ncbi:MAG: hypothetical protein NTV80_09780 [Verrucomicrobia bacterium]|nr:hypothetical protein [Verrucomicrobiota bacterium]